jgi:chlorobactene glucosyltransferase
MLIALITIVNVFTFPRLDHTPGLDARQEGPLVSVLIPARNEAAVIRATVEHLLDQDYAPFEVVILDDESTDGTAELALATGRGAPNLRVVKGRPLPPGWLGKNWACHQLSQVATGEILVFTDADVIWTPAALSHLVGEMRAKDADLQTVWPTQITKSWTERLVVPLMAFVIVGYLPLLAVHHISWPVFAAAMGQCLAFRRATYDRVGGHAAVRDSIVEDVTFAKRVKSAGLKLRVADGGTIIRCRMYHSWHEVRNGFAKNILAGHGNSIPFLLVSWFFHWLLWLAPWIWLIGGVFLPLPWWPVWPSILIVLGTGIRALTAAFSRQRVRDAVWMPVSTLLMAVIASQAIGWHLIRGGPSWRDRTIHVRSGEHRRASQDHPSGS